MADGAGVSTQQRRDIAPRKVFAQRFAALYDAAGAPPLRRVAAGAAARMRGAAGPGSAATASAQRISDWKAGRNVPARFESLLPVLLTLIEQARKRGAPLSPELGEVAAWRRLWAECDGKRGETEETAAPCPYLGLTAYGSDDARLFFGRSRPTAELAALIRDTVAPDGPGGLVMLVGASGAGKSSLLHAGVVPALTGASDEWAVAGFTPGAAPLTALCHAVGGDLESWAPQRRRLLIVDQFEELFTACADERERAAFLTQLQRAAVPSDSPDRHTTAVVIAIRADFFGRCLDYPVLQQALDRRSYLLGPMRLDELAEAITAPAELAGLKLEPGLEELVITELCGVGEHPDRPGYDPGALPLLSHVMAAVWQHREGPRLTIACYRKVGGVVGSVAATAEDAWADLDESQRIAAKQLLLGLVTVGRDSRDTRRRATRKHLLARVSDRAAATAALETLTRTRLVTLDQGERTRGTGESAVYLTHEIVLDAWPRLRAWIDEDRVGSLIRQRLETDAAEWDALDRDPSLLYRGTRLLTALDNTGPDAGAAEISPVTRQFLASSEAARTRARRRASTARAVQAALVVVVLVLAVAAYTQSRQAVRQRNDAVFAGVLAEADRVADTSPALAAQLDLVVHRMRPHDREVTARLLGTQNTPLPTVIGVHAGSVKQLAYRRDGRVLASAGHDNTVRLWDVADPRHPRALGRPLAGHREFMTSAVFSPDGALLASAGGDHTVRLWDVRDPAHARQIGAPLVGGSGAVFQLSFRPDGRILAAPNDDGTVALWDVADPAAPRLITTAIRQAGPVRTAAFSPDGRTLAVAGDDFTVRLWNVADPAAPVPSSPPLGGFAATVRSVAFSPDGTLLAAGSEDTTVRLWTVADPADPRPCGSPLLAHTAEVWSVNFDQTGHRLATGSTDGTARIWNLNDPTQPRAIGGPLTSEGSVLSAVFSPAGDTLAVGGHDGAIRLWSLPSIMLDGHVGRVAAPAFSADGSRMATGSVDGNIVLWDTRDPARPRQTARLHVDTQLNTITLSPDGRTIAAVDQTGTTVRLFDVADPAAITPLAVWPVGARFSYELAFSPDSRLLLTADGDHSMRLWSLTDRAHPTPYGAPIPVGAGFVSDAKFRGDATVIGVAVGGRGMLFGVGDPAHPTQLTTLATTEPNAVHRLAFARDGRLLVTGGEDGLRLWDVRDPAAPSKVGEVLSSRSAGVDAVAVSSDGRTVVTGESNSVVHLFDITDPVHIAMVHNSIATPDSPTWWVTFDPAADYLGAGGERGMLRMWDLDPGHAARRICDISRGTMNRRLWHDYLPQLPYRPPCG
jgi:WD40 repeat protein